MEMKRTMTMNFDGLASHRDSDNDNDNFFDTNNRISSFLSFDVLAATASQESSEDEFDEPRMSFASAASSSSSEDVTRHMSASQIPPLPASSNNEEYDIWMRAPTTSIQERRRKLFQGMGLNSSKELVRLRTMALSKKGMSVNVNNVPVPPPAPPVPSCKKGGVREAKGKDNGKLILVRSRSDGDIVQFSIETKKRKEQLIGKVSKRRLTRTLSTVTPYTRLCKLNRDSSSISGDINDNKGRNETREKTSTAISNVGGDELGAFFLIKNLDTGKEFIVKEFNEDGMWNRLSDLQTGKQLTMEEFEQCVGYSPVVNELMRRDYVRRNGGGDGGGSVLERKTSVNAYLSKSLRYSKRRGVSLLKNLNRVMSSGHEKEHNNVAAIEPPRKSGKWGSGSQSNEWVRVRTQGKVYKEFTALRFSQEIQAHQGSIWTIKFSLDGRYLASAGEDKVIHVWEVQECEIASLRPPDDVGNGTPFNPVLYPSPDRDNKQPLAPDLSSLDKKKKGKFGSRKGGLMPDYVKLPETVFSLSSEPVCSFEGHLDDVLDLSWSSQMQLLSSSMDKTVRLWDMETKTCLKLFAHNDYVTCIQFNPVDDDYFISGSLDAKVRIWSVPGRRVVDWTDLHEMVTAACYTPDGQGAVVGSHKGNCRLYSITDEKLNQISQFDVQNKKKGAPKKITGFQFMPERPNEFLVTSADSRIRICDGTEVLQKLRGFRNTSSQIAASFTPDGKYVICGSEDSNVYVWKREEPRNGKTKTIINTKSYEHFPCKDVSVAIPWPGSLRYEPPTIQLHSKRNSKRVTPASSTSSPKKQDTNKNSKRKLPPLPSKKSTFTPAKSDKISNINENRNDDNVDGEKGPESPKYDPSSITRTESGVSGLGSSFSSTGGGSIRYGDSPSISSNHASSPSRSSSWSWFDGSGSHGGDTMQARAWGLVIVTAGLGGEIRAYQNFGVPLRVGRQANLFRDLT